MNSIHTLILNIMNPGRNINEKAALCSSQTKQNLFLHFLVMGPSIIMNFVGMHLSTKSKSNFYRTKGSLESAELTIGRPHRSRLGAAIELGRLIYD